MNLFLALLKLHGEPKNDEILHIFWPHRYLFCSHAQTRQNIAILKKNWFTTEGCSTLVPSSRTLCQGRSVRACVHSVGMLCGYIPNSSWIQEAQLVLTNPRDAFRGQSRSPNMVKFDMLGMISYAIVTLSLRRAFFWDIRLQKMQWPWNPG